MFNSTVKSCSKELTAKERIAIKDTQSAIKLDEAVNGEGVDISVDYYAVVGIHNDKATPVDYDNYVLVDYDGNKYVTGSQSFWNAFESIANEMAGEEEAWGVHVYKRPSKNYSGKEFLTCHII